MTPGQPLADLIFGAILGGTAHAHAVATECTDADLRKALAALSVFRGPGTFARDIAIALIREELTDREARHG